MSNTFPPEELRAPAHQLAKLLTEQGQKICVAETASGGLVSASLLSYPGASKIFAGGLTLYTLESRTAFAGWTAEDTTNYRGPTPEVVTKLATNVRKTLGATYCICESGTAGPTGGNTPNRTPGYVALALVGPDGVTTREVDTGLGGDRSANMVAFAKAALELAIEVVKGQKSSL